MVKFYIEDDLFEIYDVDEEEFKKLMPKCTDKLYKEFKTALSSIKESKLFNYILNKSIKPICIHRLRFNGSLKCRSR